MECPLATIDGQVNLKNHLTTIRIAGLGPPNPNLPNNQFWQAKAVRWEVGVNEARSRLCSNCGHYIFTPQVQECMKQHDNITPDMVGPEWVDTHDSGGWCNLYNITCTAHRTCVDWEPGGPVTTEDEMEMEERDDAAKPKTKKAKQAKIAKVMHEFQAGTLKGSDKKPITNRKQAIAIALSEAGMSMAGKSDAYWDGYINTTIDEWQSSQADESAKMDAMQWNTENRKKLKEGSIEGAFAGPAMSFPIASPEDVANAWSSVGRAANPRAIEASIIRIAKKFGWESGLPATVRERLKSGENGVPPKA